MKRYLNYEALIEGACCLLFSVMMFGMAYSKSYLLFVTPRMEPFLYFTGVRHRCCLRNNSECGSEYAFLFRSIPGYGSRGNRETYRYADRPGNRDYQ